MARCRLCQSLIRQKNANTTNLWSHLKANHPELYPPPIAAAAVAEQQQMTGKITAEFVIVRLGSTWASWGTLCRLCVGSLGQRFRERLSQKVTLPPRSVCPADAECRWREAKRPKCKIFRSGTPFQFKRCSGSAFSRKSQSSMQCESASNTHHYNFA